MDFGDTGRVERLEDRFGLLGGVGDPAADGGVIGPLGAEEDAEQILDLAGADAHGEGGHGQSSSGGPVEAGDLGWGGDGDFGRGRRGGLGLQPSLELAGVVIERLPAAVDLLGAAGDRPVRSGEDSGGVADEMAER